VLPGRIEGDEEERQARVILRGLPFTHAEVSEEPVVTVG